MQKTSDLTVSREGLLLAHASVYKEIGGPVCKASCWPHGDERLMSSLDQYDVVYSDAKKVQVIIYERPITCRNKEVWYSKKSKLMTLASTSHTSSHRVQLSPPELYPFDWKSVLSTRLIWTCLKLLRKHCAGFSLNLTYTLIKTCSNETYIKVRIDRDLSDIFVIKTSLK